MPWFHDMLADFYDEAVEAYVVRKDKDACLAAWRKVSLALAFKNVIHGDIKEQDLIMRADTFTSTRWRLWRNGRIVIADCWVDTGLVFDTFNADYECRGFTDYLMWPDGQVPPSRKVK